MPRLGDSHLLKTAEWEREGRGERVYNSNEVAASEKPSQSLSLPEFARVSGGRPLK